jgi:hypothetical protein
MKYKERKEKNLHLFIIFSVCLVHPIFPSDLSLLLFHPLSRPSVHMFLPSVQLSFLPLILPSLLFSHTKKAFRFFKLSGLSDLDLPPLKKKTDMQVDTTIV